MKIWPSGVAVCCGSLLLAGCYNDDKIMMLAEAQADQKNASQAIHKQIKALEEAVLTLHQEIIGIKQAMHEEKLAAAEKNAPPTNNLASAAEAESAAGTEPAPKAPNASKDYTRREFIEKVTGMTPERLAQFIGQPNNKIERDQALYWVYNEISCKKDDGSVELISAQIVFENDRVLRANFAEDVQYGGLSLKK